MRKVLVDEKWSVPQDVSGDTEYKQLAQEFFEANFSETDSKRINSLVQGIRINRMSTAYLTFVEYAILGESRSLEEEHLAAPVSGSASDRRHSASEYALWDFTPDEDIAPFHDGTRKKVVPESRFFSTCTACAGKKDKPCLCGDGYEKCPQCYGNGDVRCKSCGGSGWLRCRSCGGRGEVSERRFEGTDPSNGQYIYKDYYVRCSDCGGSGEYTCGGCNGRGTCICRQCNGDGKITCRRCRGSKRVNCSSCNGAGAFLDQVVLKENLKTMRMFSPLILDDATAGDDLNNWDIEPNERDDRVVYRVEDTEPLLENQTDLLDGVWDLRGLFNEVSAEQAESPDFRYLKYYFTLYERKMLDVFYQFGDKEYCARIDLVERQYVLNADPLSEMNAQAQNAIADAEQEKRYRDLGQALTDYISTKGEDEAIDPAVDAIKKKTDNYFTKIALIGPAILLLMSMITHRYVYALSSFWLSFGLQEAITVVLARIGWKRLASNQKYVTEGLIVLMGCIIAAVIKYGLRWF